MIIGGLQKFSLLDYPGHLSAIIFTQGCNFNCQFCYNPMLVAWPIAGNQQKDHHPVIKEGDLFDFFTERIGKLEGVVITGGEPTMHPDLPDFIAKIKKMGYFIKLDTNGSNPEMLEKLIAAKLLDYIAMDIKAPASKYAKTAGKPVDYEKIKKSVRIIMDSKLPYEFRTTIVPGLISAEDIAPMAELIKGADQWYLQQFKSNVDLLNKKLQGIKPFTDAEMKEMRETGGMYVKKCEIR